MLSSAVNNVGLIIIIIIIIIIMQYTYYAPLYAKATEARDVMTKDRHWLNSLVRASRH